MSDTRTLSRRRALACAGSVAVLAAVLFAGAPSAATRTPVSDSSVSAKALLEESDRARGGNSAGLLLQSTVTSYVNNTPDKSYTVTVEAARDNTLVSFVKPERSRGIKMLVQGRNMWFLSPEVHRPVPISPRQRLIGEANNGDLATINYSRDYDPTLLGEEAVGNEPCYVLELKAKSRDVTYDKIVYYVSKQTKLGIKAEYYTLSGKHFKSALIEYGNAVQDGDRKLPFVSRMEIQDEIQKSGKTVLSYSTVEARSIPPSRFDKSLLMNN